VTLGPCAGLAVCAVALVGCAGNEPQPRLDAVSPVRSYTDRDIRLTMTGADFVPSYRLDSVSGELAAVMEGFSGRVISEVSSEVSWVPLSDFGWISPTQISAGLAKEAAEELSSGFCDVEITDPRGRRTVLQAGFLALGRDPPPDVAVGSPVAGEIYAPGSTIHGNVTATDQSPGHLTALTWSYTEPGSAGRQVAGACPVGLDTGRMDCTFDVTVSTSLLPYTTVHLAITASDDAVPPNQTSPDFPIMLGARPTVSAVTPLAGGMAGGTNVVIQGSGFVPGSRAYFGTSLLIPDGGIVVNTEIITGYTPAHFAGPAPVTVQSRLGFASWDHKFEYQLPPQIASISPSVAAPGRDTPVRVLGASFTATTIIYLGQTLARATPLARALWRSAEEITGVVPGSSGKATVWAFDPNNGWTSLPDGFSWTVP